MLSRRPVSLLAAGIGLALENATQWKDVIKTAIQTAIIMTILDRLGIVGGEPWLEARRRVKLPPCGCVAFGRSPHFRPLTEWRGWFPARCLQVHLDTLSVQATMLSRSLGWREELRVFMQFISRIEAK